MIKISRACIDPDGLTTWMQIFGDYLGMGQYVREFGAKLSEYFGGNMQGVAVNASTSALLITERLYDQIVTLPLYCHLTGPDVALVGDKIKPFFAVSA